MNEPNILTINPNAISEKKAEKNVNEPLIKSQWQTKKYGFTFGPDYKEFSYLDFILSSKKTGVISQIQNNIDYSDDIFGGTFGLSTPNFQIPITTTFAGFSKTLESPSISTPIEDALADDILFYREETCIESNNYDFEMTCRNYRAYLFTSISLIDAFINKHILIYDYRGLKSSDFDALKSSRITDERIELLVKISSSSSNIEVLHSSIAWNDYKKLKGLRNNVVHSLEPFFGHSIPEFALHLNLIRTGVGELLKMILEFQDKVSLGFIEKLRNAPEVFYHKVTLKGDGKHIIKKIENN
jgi:hypothetical protein